MSARRVALPAKMLMLATTVLSTLVSFFGGLLMYLEGLRIIEDTVQEISRVELRSTADLLNRSIMETVAISDAYTTLLTGWSGFPTKEAWQSFLQVDQFGRTRSSNLYGIGIAAVPLVNVVGNESGFMQLVWWDPLADGTRDWLTAAYLPRYWGRCTDSPRSDTLQHRCVVGHHLDPVNGSVMGFAYQWSDNLIIEVSDGGRWDKQQAGWEEKGAVWWRRPDVWHSKDNTSYIYGTLMRTVRKQPPGHPIWGAGYKLLIPAWNTFYHWEAELRRADVQAVLVATFLRDGLDSQAIATNVGEPLLLNCTERSSVTGSGTGRTPCIVTLRDLRPDIQEACVKANMTQADRFFRTSIGGSAHWVMRLIVLETREDYDEMDNIELVWMRRVSTVEDELHRALYFFIGFVAAVFIFDVGVLLVEVRHIAQPLERLEWAMRPVDQMDLSASYSRLEGVCPGGGFSVTEVHRLVRRFRHTLDALTTYRPFLPQSCLHRDADADDMDSLSGASRAQRASASQRQPSPAVSEERAQSTGTKERVINGLSTSSALSESVGAQTAQPQHMAVTLLAVNGRGLLKSSAFRESPRAAAEMIGAGANQFATTVAQFHGNVDLVSGDHHFASFGAAHRCTSHRTKALSCAWALRAERGALQSSAAVCSGAAFCGDFGGAAIMRFMVIGGLPCVLPTLERMASQRAIDVLIDSRVHQDAVSWSCCLIDRVVHPKLFTGPFSVWSVTARMQDEDGHEWMYQLVRVRDPYDVHNTVLTHILKGELRAARAAIAAVPEQEELSVVSAEQPAVTDYTSRTLPVGAEGCFPAVDNAVRALRKLLAEDDAHEGCARHSLLQDFSQTVVRQESPISPMQLTSPRVEPA
eukprot:TRINITY_DN6118_c0_g1_i1.p1 TRINITY_DN6118_c0_g1~~TRINITY_DN6118_c0_g1_i1.p1  ORF type:complete len:887 (+),score=130.88 TRINITY_DN6118_c0_g1_i1:69-2663(+)